MEFKLYERYCRIPIKILTILAQNTLIRRKARKDARNYGNNERRFIKY